MDMEEAEIQDYEIIGGSVKWKLWQQRHKAMEVETYMHYGDVIREVTG